MNTNSVLFIHFYIHIYQSTLTVCLSLSFYRTHTQIHTSPDANSDEKGIYLCISRSLS